MDRSTERLILEQLSEINARTSRTDATVCALNERLFDGPASVITTVQQDIQEIKDDRKVEARWERLHNVLHYSIGPALIGLHTFLRKIGIGI